MKEKSNKDDDFKMKELSSTIIFKERSDITFFEENLDNNSIYSYIFLTSIYHDNIEELKEHLKLQFHYESKYNISKEEYLSTKDDYFDKNFNELNLKEKEEKNINKKVFKPMKIEEENECNKNLFIISFFIALLLIIFQLTFLYIIIREYLGREINFETNTKLNIMRYMIYLCLLFKSYIEFLNGKKIVSYSIYYRFLYKTQIRRLFCLLMGLVQICINCLLFIYFSKVLFISESVIKCIEIFCVFIVVSQFDEWIGGFYIKICKQMRNYTRDDFKQICLYNNTKCRITFIDIILNIIFYIIILMSFLFSRKY